MIVLEFKPRLRGLRSIQREFKHFITMKSLF
jgi:hypothetical protein